MPKCGRYRRGKPATSTTEIGEGERILATALVERFVIRADSELQPLTKGSTRPVTSTVTHAGI